MPLKIEPIRHPDYKPMELIDAVQKQDQLNILYNTRKANQLREQRELADSRAKQEREIAKERQKQVETEALRGELTNIYNTIPDERGRMIAARDVFLKIGNVEAANKMQDNIIAFDKAKQPIIQNGRVYNINDGKVSVGLAEGAEPLDQAEEARKLGYEARKGDVDIQTEVKRRNAFIEELRSRGRLTPSLEAQIMAGTVEPPVNYFPARVGDETILVREERGKLPEPAQMEVADEKLTGNAPAAKRKVNLLAPMTAFETKQAAESKGGLPDEIVDAAYNEAIENKDPVTMLVKLSKASPSQQKFAQTIAKLIYSGNTEAARNALKERQLDLSERRVVVGESAEARKQAVYEADLVGLDDEMQAKLAAVKDDPEGAIRVTSELMALGRTTPQQMDRLSKIADNADSLLKAGFTKNKLALENQKVGLQERKVALSEQEMKIKENLTEVAKKTMTPEEALELKTRFEKGEFESATAFALELKNNYEGKTAAQNVLDAWLENIDKTQKNQIAAGNLKARQDTMYDTQARKDLSKRSNVELSNALNMPDSPEKKTQVLQKMPFASGPIAKAAQDYLKNETKTNSILEGNQARISQSDVTVLNDYLDQGNYAAAGKYINLKAAEAADNKAHANYWEKRKAEVLAQENAENKRREEQLKNTVNPETMKKWLEVKGTGEDQERQFLLNIPEIEREKIMAVENQIGKNKTNEMRYKTIEMGNKMKEITLNKAMNEKTFSTQTMLDAASEGKLGDLLLQARADPNQSKEQTKIIESMVEDQKAAEKEKNLAKNVDPEQLNEIVNSQKSWSDKLRQIAILRPSFVKGSNGATVLDNAAQTIKYEQDKFLQNEDREIRAQKEALKSQMVRDKDEKEAELTKLLNDGNMEKYYALKASMEIAEGKDPSKSIEERQKLINPKKRSNIKILQDEGMQASLVERVFNTEEINELAKELLSPSRREDWKQLKGLLDEYKQIDKVDQIFNAGGLRPDLKKGFGLLQQLRLYRADYAHALYGATLTGNELRNLNTLLDPNSLLTNGGRIWRQLDELRKAANAKLARYDRQYGTSFVGGR